MKKYHQQVIGTDKKNPFFNIFIDETESMLYIYIGVVLYSKIPITSNNQTNAILKIEIAKLFNAKVNQAVLHEKFGFAISTMRRWAEAIKTGDIDIISAAISGPGAPVKMNSEIKRFVEVRFNDIYQTNKYSYSKIIREEIEEIYKIQISGETLRLIFKRLKSDFGANISIEKPSESQMIKNEKKANTLDSPEIKSQENIAEPNSNKELNENEIAPTDTDNRKNSLDNERQIGTESTLKRGYAHHVGIMLFVPFINEVIESLQIGKDAIKQWIIFFLLGILNIEQSKHIDFNSLEVLFGQMTKVLEKQRQILSQLADDEEVINAVIAANSKLVGVASQTDFYFDPHSKHYTGEVKILKGWCGNLGKPAKAIYLDFLHNINGEPVYLEHFDNFMDIRKIFFDIIDNFRNKSGITAEKIITIVVDRAIFSKDFFTKIIDKPTIHIVTWEKNYLKDQWDENKSSKSFYYNQFRNNSKDLLPYEFSFQENIWSKNKSMRQFIVRAINHKSNPIEVSVLTDDLERAGEEIIMLIFKRWIQENDFKYMIKHFGLDEIVSYNFVEYKQLRDLQEDKKVESGEFKAHKMGLKKLRVELKNYLLKKFTSKNKLQKWDNELLQIQTQPVADNDKKEIKKIEKKQILVLDNIAKIDQKINSINEKIITIELNKSKTKEKVSKLDEMIKEGYSRFMPQKKYLMDFVRIISRNIFYKALESFKTKYDNYRDDHAIFRKFTQSDGYILSTTGKLIIIINPTGDYPPRITKIFNEYLTEFNEKKITIGDDKLQLVKIILGKKKNKLFDIVDDKINEICPDYALNSSI